MGRSHNNKKSFEGEEFNLKKNAWPIVLTFLTSPWTTKNSSLTTTGLKIDAWETLD